MATMRLNNINSVKLCVRVCVCVASEYIMLSEYFKIVYQE